MKTLKQKFAAAGIAIASLFGYHAHQKPTIQTEQHWFLNSEHKHAPISKPQPTSTPAASSFAPTIQKPTINLVAVNGATNNEEVMVRMATTRANLILADDRFMNDVLDEKEFTETNNMTNAQIYDLLSHNPMSVTVEIYDGDWKENYVWKTQGYEDENYPNTVFANRYFLDGVTYMASLETHEAEGHGQGFHHYNVKETSIPYKFNGYIESIAAMMGFTD